MDLESSVELIQRAKAGDQDALNQLLARYLPRLRRWARDRLPARARDLSDTDDLVQEAVIRTLRNLKTFDYRGEGSLQAYLRHAIVNRVRDETRRAAARPEHKELSVTDSDNAQSPLEVAIGREAVERYERALEVLSPADREAVIARLELGYSFREIADSVGKPSADAARVAVSRALSTLAEHMSKMQMATKSVANSPRTQIEGEPTSS